MDRGLVTIRLTVDVSRVFPVPGAKNEWKVGTEFIARRIRESIGTGWIVKEGPEAGLGIRVDCATEVEK